MNDIDDILVRKYATYVVRYAIQPQQAADLIGLEINDIISCPYIDDLLEEEFIRKIQYEQLASAKMALWFYGANKTEDAPSISISDILPITRTQQIEIEEQELERDRLKLESYFAKVKNLKEK